MRRYAPIWVYNITEIACWFGIVFSVFGVVTFALVRDLLVLGIALGNGLLAFTCFLVIKYIEDWRKE